jgi:sister chromatid cohesion protein DCC1
VHFAREILKEGKRKIDSFMVEWLQKIPEGMRASFDTLEGEILMERLGDGVETWVRPFSVSSLPFSHMHS